MNIKKKPFFLLVEYNVLSILDFCNAKTFKNNNMKQTEHY